MGARNENYIVEEGPEKLTGKEWDAVMQLVIHVRVALTHGVIDKKEYPRCFSGMIADLERCAPLVGEDEIRNVERLRREILNDEPAVE